MIGAILKSIGVYQRQIRICNSFDGGTRDLVLCDLRTRRFVYISAKVVSSSVTRESIVI